MSSPAESPRGARLLILLAGLSVGLFGLVAFWLISAGAFDPKPIGELHQKRMINQIITVTNTRHLTWVDDQPESDTFSVRLNAALVAGSEDIGFGLVIGEEGDNVIIAISPVGYVAILDGSINKGIASDDRLENWTSGDTIPWQTWPHVSRGLSNNEIWLDVIEGNLVTVRVNKELLWEEPIPLVNINIGLWAESYGETAIVEFKDLAYFKES